MARSRNTKGNGASFDQAAIAAVWRKGAVIPNHDAAEWRRDVCGNAIQYSAHGNTNSQFGWEVDHIRPVASGGGDDLANLQPLQWDANRRKGDAYPWRC